MKTKACRNGRGSALLVRRAALSGVLVSAIALGCSVYDSSLLGTESMPVNSSGDASTLGGADSSAGAPANGGDTSLGGASSGTSGDVPLAGDSSGGMAGMAGAMDEPGGSGGAVNAAGAMTAGGTAMGGAAMGGASSAGAGGTVGVSGSPNAGGSAGAAPVVHELAKGKKATASSQQTGNDVAKGNDGDSATRWCAQSSAMPQWWRVDLGATHLLKQVTVKFEHPERKYSYVIETSQNDSVYMQQVIANGTGSTQVLDLPSNVSARYVRITVTSGTPGSGGDLTWASFFEFAVTGT